MIWNSVPLDHRDDVCGRKAGEGGFCEVRVFGEEIFRAAVDVGEIAPAASGDEDLLADALCVIQQDDPAAAAACFDCAHHSGGTGAQDYDINLLHSSSLILTLLLIQ